jgi:hypothetical protein
MKHVISPASYNSFGAKKTDFSAHSNKKLPIAPGQAVVLFCAQSAFRASIIELLARGVGEIAYVTVARIVHMASRSERMYAIVA